jgi:hypothetical protein
MPENTAAGAKPRLRPRGGRRPSHQLNTRDRLTKGVFTALLVLMTMTDAGEKPAKPLRSACRRAGRPRPPCSRPRGRSIRLDRELRRKVSVAERPAEMLLQDPVVPWVGSVTCPFRAHR